MFTNKKRQGINRFVCNVSLYVAETPKASIKYHKPPLPIIPFGIVAYGFVGQPFSKQLYTLTVLLLWSSSDVFSTNRWEMSIGQTTLLVFRSLLGKWPGYCWIRKDVHHENARYIRDGLHPTCSLSFSNWSRISIFVWFYRPLGSCGIWDSCAPIFYDHSPPRRI